jgi:phosphoribosylaminoimidazole-succinocarboxamide synthase
LQDSYAEKLAAEENPEGLDKEFLRLWVNERCDPYKDDIPEIPEDTLVEFAGRYIQLFETVTGQEFSADARGTAVLDRIRTNLAGYF